MLILVSTSLMLLMVETQVNERVVTQSALVLNRTENQTYHEHLSRHGWGYIFHKSRPADWLLWVEFIITTILAFDLAMRFLLCASKRQFFNSHRNVWDCVSVIPMVAFFIILFVSLAAQQFHTYTGEVGFFMLNSLRLLRASRIVYSLYRNAWFRILCYIVRVSTPQLTLVACTTLIFVCLAGYILFLSEMGHHSRHDNGYFFSAFDGAWCVFVTITTVGYGDVIPADPTARMVDSLVLLLSVVYTGTSAAILTSNFLRVHKLIQSFLLLDPSRPIKRQMTADTVMFERATLTSSASHDDVDDTDSVRIYQDQPCESERHLEHRALVE